jgi:mono/diheme cytochrome c family protein
VVACAWAAALGPAAGRGPEEPAPAAGSDGEALFAGTVEPLLAARCLGCHGPDAAEGGLRLDLRAGWAEGGDSGPAILPGEPERSLLVRAIRWEAPAPQMPPDGRLSDDEIARVEEWVRRGAPDPRGGSLPPRGRNLPGGTAGMTAEEGRMLWSLRPLDHPATPEVADPAWNHGPIDPFVRARLDAAGIAPQPEAAAPVLVRRITQDLTGLPPEPGEIDAFVAAHGRDPDAAVAELADRLLDSPAYGERFARHWLDLARFAESSGGGRTLLFADAWRYRDWVVAAFQADMPFDRFVAAQLAGDLRAASAHDPEEIRAGLVACGFLVLGPTNYEEQDKPQLRLDVVDEQLETIGRAFLGLSIGCARCHDHPADPLSQADYYRLAGIFTSTRTLLNETDNVARWIARPLPEAEPIAARRAAIDAARAALRAERAGLVKEAGKGDPPPRVAAIDEELRRLAAELPPRPTAMAVEEQPEPSDTALRVRGVEKTRGATVPRGLPEVFAADVTIPAAASGRAELAAWIGAADSPLPRRVIVNRVWGWLLGRGLVPSVDDFGAEGDPPSHPELLERLVQLFNASGGRVKPLVRAIVLSRTYRQASAAPSPLDPDDRLLGRARRRRLDAEQIHDALLAAAGTLDRTVGGPTIHGAAEIDANSTAAQAIEYGYVFEGTRRGLYVPAFRNRRPDLFEVFDAAAIDASSGERHTSTVASQALVLANHPFVVEACRRVAARVAAEAADTPGRVDRVFRLLLSRDPLGAERVAAEAFLARAGGDPEAWAVLCQALVESPDFRFLD